MRKTRSFLKLPVLLVTVFIGKARFCDRSPDQFHQRWRHRRPDPLKPGSTFGRRYGSAAADFRIRLG
jgi:hypothetical protein